MTSGEYPDDFDLITAMQGAKARAEDFQRHQDAVAGRETGYGNRHQHGEGRKGDADLQRRLQSSTALDLLMQDPAYAALRQDTLDLLARAETAIEQALTDAQDTLTDAQDALDGTMEHANRLPDGTAVFKDTDGNIYTEDGRLVGPEEADSVVWKDDAPSYEEFQKRKQAVEDARLRIEELRRFQDEVLGPARERLHDPDNPPSPDEIEQIRDDVQNGLDEIVNTKANRLSDANHEGTPPQSSSNIFVRDLGS